MGASEALLPGSVPMTTIRAASSVMSSDDFRRVHGEAFFLLVGTGESKDDNIGRSISWDEPSESTDDVGLAVVSARAKAPGRSPFLSIGRGSVCDVVIADTTVSKLHAFMRASSPLYELFDAGSHNGTFVDTARVAVRAEGNPTLVKSPATVRFGSVTLMFLLADDLRALARKLGG